MVHLVGLGGGGCNVLEYAMKQGFEASYTFVTSPKRSHLPEDVEFIEFKSPPQYYANAAWYKADVVLPEALREKLLKHLESTIFTCIGGYAGTMLLKAILDYKWPETSNFRFIVGTPFHFEGTKRSKLFKYFKTTYKNRNLEFIPLEQISKTRGGKVFLSTAFQLADLLMFSKIATQYEKDTNHPYIVPFVLQASSLQSCLSPHHNSVLYDLLKERSRYYNKQFEFTEENVLKIQRVNDLLQQKVKEAYAQAEAMEVYLLQQMQQPNSFVSDYEIEFRVSLWSPKKYSHIEALEGNPFFDYNPHIHYYKKDCNPLEIEEHKHWLFEEDHYEYPEALKGFKHSWLLHGLYDHTWLAWQDIADIEEIWFDVEVKIQNFSCNN